jgi:signal transduction histidine kinase
VRDNGIGIPLDEQPRLFQRFFRASTAREHAVQGTGLGLSLVKAVVERHGGRVDLDSSPGKGTTVAVTLPVVQVPAGTHTVGTLSST